MIYRLENANVSMARRFWECLVEEFGIFFDHELVVTQQRFLIGIASVVKAASQVAEIYKRTYLCHLVLSGKGGSGKTFFVNCFCRAILSSDLKLRLAVGKQIGRSKESLGGAVRVYDEHFASFSKNPKIHKGFEPVKNKSVFYNFTDAEKPIRFNYQSDTRQMKFTASIFAGASGPTELPSDKKFTDLFKKNLANVTQNYYIWKSQICRRFYFAQIKSSFRKYSESFFNRDMLNKGSHG